MFVMISGSGCGTRVVYLKDGDIVRIRKSVKAKVLVYGKDAKPYEATVELQAGWFAGPPPK